MAKRGYPSFAHIEMLEWFLTRCKRGEEKPWPHLNPPALPEGCQSAEDKYVEWIVQWLKQELAAKKILEADASGWTAQSHEIAHSRKYTKMLSEDVDRAKNALRTLEECFKNHKRLRTNYREDGIYKDDPMLETSFGFIRGQLETVGDWIEGVGKRGPHGNFPTNRALCILEIWEALEPDFPMRAAARIMAQAFERVGLETGLEKKRRESIYQTIRNASR